MLVARSADSDALKAQHFVIHPANRIRPGYTAPKHITVRMTLPAATQNSLRYTTVPNWKTQLHGATGFNELGLA